MRLREGIDFLVKSTIGDPPADPPPWITNLAIVDLDQDGLLDVVICDATRNQIAWIRQSPLGTFNESTLSALVIAPAHVTPNDFDQDGDIDLLIAEMGQIPPSNAKIGDLYLKWARRDDAERRLREALELDSLEPVAALGVARLESLTQNWHGVLDVMTPLLARYPRLSKAHQFVAAAYGALGDEALLAHHQEEGEYGSAVESELMNALNELAVAAILEGNPSRGPALLASKCARCHNHERIYDHDRDRAWWARTVRRMQRDETADWTAQNIRNITRLAVSPSGKRLAFVADAVLSFSR